MELVRCPNCLTVYGDVQDRCPSCGADERGEGAEVTFDSETRAALNRLGGIYGGILAGPPEPYVLWCERGVCLVDEQIGLLWVAKVYGQVKNVVPRRDEIRVSTTAGEVRLDRAGGFEIEESGR